MPGAYAADAPNPFERRRAGRHPSPMNFLRFILRSLAARRTRAELHGLSDHVLRDIGLERGQIERLFR
jgi:uncharacterized protein YjiS (DUF1127 family)